MTNGEESFGDVLRRLRIEKGLTLGSVARELGVSVVYVSDVERNRRPPFVAEKMKRVAELLGVSLGTLQAKAAFARGNVNLQMSNVPERAHAAAASLGRGDLPDQFWDELVDLAKKYPPK